MGIQINGQTDIISAIDGSLTIQGASGNLTGDLTGNINSTGVSTFTTLSATSIVGVSTLGVTTAYVNTLSGISTIDASSDIFINRSLKFASGYGIDFSATANSSGTMTSELLSDYEEGTFTPTVIGTSSVGTGTYQQQLGVYTKIGRQVFFTIYLEWSAHTGTGNINVRGLPFTAAASTYIQLFTIAASTITTVSSTILACYATSNTADIAPFTFPIGGGLTGSIGMDTAGTLYITGAYHI